jgi:hypothetical protein
MLEANSEILIVEPDASFSGTPAEGEGCGRPRQPERAQSAISLAVRNVPMSSVTLFKPCAAR